MKNKELGFELLHLGLKMLSRNIISYQDMIAPNDIVVLEMESLVQRAKRTTRCGWCQDVTEEENGLCRRCKNHKAVEKKKETESV